MHWTTNTTTMRERSRHVSPRTEYIFWSTRARSDLETKKSSTPSARLSWVRIIREYTQQQQSVIVLGSVFFFEKYHVKRPSASLRGQTRVCQRRLGCLSPGRAKRTRRVSSRRQTQHRSRRWLESCEDKQKNGPNTISGSDFAQEVCFDLHERDLFLIEKSI